IKDSIKLIVVGNVISSHHVEIAQAETKNIPIISFPEFLQTGLLSKTQNIVIVGTHGKSTCSALMSYVAEKTNQNPSFFIGAVAKDFPSSFRVTDSSYFILEGDEYDSSFFLKQPKFLYYNPAYALLTGVEFDHGDIYKNLDQIKKLFCQFVQKIPKEGLLVACAEDPYASEVVKHCKADVVTYGWNQGDWRIKNRTVKDRQQCFEIYSKDEFYNCSISLLGKHNALNALAVFVLAKKLNWPVSDILSALRAFTGLQRRLEFKFEWQSVKIFEDFAHHPSAVQAGLSALKESYPHQRLLALFEPRSFTSRLNVFQKDYISSFLPADLIFIAPAYDSSKISEDKRFSVEQLVQDLHQRGKQAVAYNSFQDLETDLRKKIKAGDIAVFMTSGSFGDLLRKLQQSALK
ncbi:MAG: Mur ligase family protein, partial [Oligoflexia bacterium]|nr:Mur ligase family protein [Oligoflexia bacterium]